MIKVYPSFWILCIVLFILGFAKELFAVFFSVTCHELAHIVVAKYFGLKCSKIILTPIGEIAVIENIDTQKFYKKILIVLAGPLSNIFILIFCLLFFPEQKFLIQSNLVIAIFNLIPIYPLDGGRIIHCLFADQIGILNANKFGAKLSKLLCRILLLLGIIQVVFFPYNISLLCMSIYLRKTSKREYLQATFQFYKNITLRPLYLLPSKTFVANPKTSIRDIVNKLSYHRYCLIQVIENEQAVAIITQERFISFINIHGMNGNIEDICNAKTYSENSTNK